MRINTVIKKISVILVFSIALMLVSCASQNGEGGKIKVVATLFPQYDFAAIIGGERAEVTMLLPFGSESHTYDPSIKDITLVSDSDIFVYTGAVLEKWASTLSENAADEGCLVLDLSKNIRLLEGVGEDAHGHSETEDSEENHTHDYDGHIWTDPENAIIMAHSIRDAYISLDPEGADYYTANTEGLEVQLRELSEKLTALSENYDGRAVYFGGRFAFLYMFDRYGFNYRSPYYGCGEESEPSIRTITEIAEEMKKNEVRHIFREEMSEGRIAMGLAEETGAELLLLHSCHNLSANEAKAGETYVSIMNKNIENLEKAIFE